MKSAYRTPSPVSDLSLVEPVREHRGPRVTCPVCGSGHYVTATSCTGSSWFWQLFGGCRRRDLHLHQKCGSFHHIGCRAEWTCAPKETL